MKKVKSLIVGAFVLLVSAYTFAGSYDKGFIQKINRSHIFFNTLRLAGNVTLASSVPYFLLTDEVTPVYENAAYLVFPAGLVLGSVSYGSWMYRDITRFYRGPLNELLVSYHNALEVMKAEVDRGKLIGSLGVNTFLLILGGVLMNAGSPQGVDVRQSNLYSVGLGLTIQSSLLLTIDLSELIVRLVRQKEVRDAWIRINI